MVGREDLTLSPCSNSFIQLWIQVRTRRYGPCFVHWCTVMLEGEENLESCITLHLGMYGLGAAALPCEPSPYSALRTAVWAYLKVT